MSLLSRGARFVVNQWHAIDHDSAAFARKQGYDFRPLVVLVVVAVSLTIQQYIGERDTFYRWFPPGGDDYWALKSYAWWSGWRFIGYVIIPVIAIWAMPGERVRDYYASVRQFWRHLRIYLGLFILVLPLVIGASGTDAFQKTYPFYKDANRSLFDLLAWEGLYALQFVSLEFFFRGFMLRGLAGRFGSAAIFVMIVPYCMIHYGKPMPETLGAIVAGLVLGTLAMRTKSIWGGAMIHIGVALTMDFLALGHCPPGGAGPCSGH
ncbi:MAG TPA: type II CAAX endopeptidase family protein [Kofleriaceae bacterium]|nr:type II CAAX endopeptidase family protein [Kofleriaceae bacterium]